MKQSKRTGLAVLTWAALAGTAWAQQPLSAIDWLNQPMPTPKPAPAARDPGLPVAQSATRPSVTVTPLGETGQDAVGLLPQRITGLPRSLWQASQGADLIPRLRRLDVSSTPALQSLLITLLLAEADPPADSTPESMFLQARLRKLTEIGAVDPALSLVERATVKSAALFALWFDLALLAGEDGRACALLESDPAIASAYSARIFCKAQNGDWQTAALTYDTARALGLLTPREDHLLALYLDPEMIEGSPDIAPSRRPTPLEFRLAEAAGSPLPTARLPIAFAAADLRDVAGWKAQIEAAERLVRAGVLSENRLLRFYTERRPSASGGVWDRARHIQQFEQALATGDQTALAARLPATWNAMAYVGLEVPFAGLFAAELARASLPGDLDGLRYEIALLGPDYETAPAPTGHHAFAATLARGAPNADLATSDLELALAKAWSIAPTDRHTALMSSKRIGEAILENMEQISTSIPGDPDGMAQGLAGLRQLGLEDTARRAALQILLMKSRR